jgi:hypothetical protein
MSDRYLNILAPQSLRQLSRRCQMNWWRLNNLFQQFVQRALSLREQAMVEDELIRANQSGDDNPCGDIAHVASTPLEVNPNEATLVDSDGQELGHGGEVKNTRDVETSGVATVSESGDNIADVVQVSGETEDAAEAGVRCTTCVVPYGAFYDLIFPFISYPTPEDGHLIDQVFRAFAVNPNHSRALDSRKQQATRVAASAVNEDGRDLPMNRQELQLDFRSLVKALASILRSAGSHAHNPGSVFDDASDETEQKARFCFSLFDIGKS